MKTEAHSRQAETAVLGAILHKPEGLATARKIVDQCDFFSATNAAIFGTMVALAEQGKSIDAVTVTAALDGTIPGYTPDQILSYLAKCTVFVADADQITEHAQSVHHKAEERQRGILTSPGLLNMSKVVEEKVEWLWPGFIPLGKLTIFDGDPCLGKSLLTLDLAARITKGRPWPDGSPGRLGNVLLLSAEDDPADTIKPRLRTAGADCEKAYFLKPAMDESDGHLRVIQIPDDLERIGEYIEATRSVLVVIDPFTAFLASSVNSHRDQDVRRVQSQLSELAGRTGAAVILVRHLNKQTTESNPLYRGGGSIATIAAARAAFLIAEDADDPERRVMAPIKTNLARKPPAQCFKIVAAGDDDPPHIEWLGDARIDARRLLDNQRQPLARDQAIDFLRRALAGGPKMTTAVEQRAQEAGIAIPTLGRARKALGIYKKKEGNRWFMRLPGQGDHLSPKTNIDPLDRDDPLPPMEGDQGDQEDQELVKPAFDPLPAQAEINL